MAITGFLSGWNEQTNQQQEEQSRQDLSQVRALENMARLRDLDKGVAVQGVLGKIFQGQEGMDDPARLAVAAKAITPLDPALGLRFAERGSTIQRQRVLDVKDQVETEKKKTQEAASILGTVTPETYQEVVGQYARLKGGLPSWYTGDYEHDAPFLQQEANAGMTRVQQLERVQKDADIANRQAQLQIERNQLEFNMKKENFKEMRQQANDTFWHDFRQEQEIAKDARAAARGQGKEPLIKATKDEQEAIMKILQRSPEYDVIDKTSLPSVILRAANNAKRRIIQDRDLTYEEAASEELGKVLGELETLPQTGWRSYLPGGLGGTKKGLRGVIGEASLPSAEEKMKPIVPGIESPLVGAERRQTKEPPKKVPSSDYPKVGDVRKGYRFKGGDPSKQSSWEVVR